MLERSIYHKILRISSLLCALVLVFQSGLVSDTSALLSSNTGSYLANVVGVTVGVAPTELNQVTAYLTEKEQNLNAREAALREREIAVDVDSQSGNDATTFILSAMLFILLCLVILNYALDYARARAARHEENRPRSGYAAN